MRHMNLGHDQPGVGRWRSVDEDAETDQVESISGSGGTVGLRVSSIRRCPCGKLPGTVETISGCNAPICGGTSRGSSSDDKTAFAMPATRGGI